MCFPGGVWGGAFFKKAASPAFPRLPLHLHAQDGGFGLAKQRLEIAGDGAHFVERFVHKGLIERPAGFLRHTHPLAAVVCPNVFLHPVEVDLLLGQVVGEYAPRLAECALEPVMDFCEDSPVIQADGRLLWRVLDNLMGNICKYALSGTRVYLTTAEAGGMVHLTVKNISRYPLNISGQELTERFVRGDASRSTEGSGLGLSIAQSLTQLQKGLFEIVIDGDLFKAHLTFPPAAEGSK